MSRRITEDFDGRFMNRPYFTPFLLPMQGSGIPITANSATERQCAEKFRASGKNSAGKNILNIYSCVPTSEIDF